jgi:hypothetical protein
VPGEKVTFDGPLATLRFELELCDPSGAPAPPPPALFEDPPTAAAELELRNKLNDELRAMVEKAFGDAEVDAASVQFQSGSVTAVLALTTGGPVELKIDAAIAAVTATADSVGQRLRRYVRDFSVRNGGPPRITVAARHVSLAGAELGEASPADTNFGAAASYALVIFLIAITVAIIVGSLAKDLT